MTLTELLQIAIDRLTRAGCDSPRLDAELLLGAALQQDRVWLYTHFKSQLTAEQVAACEPLLQRREQREPMAYILGQRDFFGLTFQLNAHVLIPRPETELLVETALEIPKKPKADFYIADVGTGSGCIAIALAKRLPQVRFFAIDLSPQALQVAQANAEAHGVAGQITFLLGDLLDSLPQSVDMIVSNPPYVSTAEIAHEVAPEVGQYEPKLALDGGMDGLEVIRKLLQQAPYKLKPDGTLLVEMGMTQGAAIKQLAAQAFPTAHIEIKPDLTRRNRLLVLRHF